MTERRRFKACSRGRPRRQCEKCPWKVTTDPREIPNGYDVAKHERLRDTVAAPGDTSQMFDPALRIMACHETPTNAPLPCVGWLVHQLGPGNNLALRFAAIKGKIDVNVETVGEQHERFEDTLPRNE